MRRLIRFPLAAATVALPILLTFAAPAHAVTGVWATWTYNNSTKTMDMPGSSFPSATITSTATNVSVPTGASTWLNTATGPGATYGSSQNQQYLQFNTATGLAPSTTVLTFASATPSSGWSFVLGDIDADAVQISATTTGGVPVTGAQLGFQSVFNFCGASPKPSTCPAGFQTDVPSWNEATRTLTGSGSDTTGAAGWFSPTVPIETLTLLFSRQVGFPVANLWLAADVSEPVTTTTTTEAPTTTTTAPTTTTAADPTTTAVDPTTIPDPDVAGSSATIANTGSGTETLVLVGNACILSGGAMVGAARAIGRRRRRQNGR